MIRCLLFNPFTPEEVLENVISEYITMDDPGEDTAKNKLVEVTLNHVNCAFNEIINSLVGSVQSSRTARLVSLLSERKLFLG